MFTSLGDHPHPGHFFPSSDSQASLRTGERGIDLREEIEDLRQPFRRNSHSRVAHRNHGVASNDRRRQVDGTAGLGVFGGVIEQIGHDLELIQKALQPTASFVDVFTSSNGFDHYDRQGAFHSKLETRRWWGECFDENRRTLGGNAPTTSEAGSDHPIRHQQCGKAFFTRESCYTWQDFSGPKLF